jgi:uncharacterized membrane protein YdbT with pleckstrin-like domain
MSYMMRCCSREKASSIRQGHRVIYKAGLFSRHTIEMSLGKVESVDVDRSILGRIFGYGTVVVRGTGGSLEPIRNIGDPLAFRNNITAG